MLISLQIWIYFIIVCRFAVRTNFVPVKFVVLSPVL